MSKKFNNISQLDCQNIYKIIIENSDRHYKIANELAINEDYYGIGISHLILSAEELAKALIIFLDGEGLHVRKVAGINKFFHNHEPRHHFSNLFVIMHFMLKHLMSFAKRINNLIHNPDLHNTATSIEKAIINQNEDGLDKLVEEFINTKLKYKAELLGVYSDFWNIADRTKQRGFYVDYVDGLYSPSSFSKSDYDFVKEVVNSFRRECKKLINKVKNITETDKKQIIKFVNKDKSIYDTIELMINVKL